jgi:hypothetical protein
MAQWWDWWLSIVTNGSVVGLVAQYWDCWFSVGTGRSVAGHMALNGLKGSVNNHISKRKF